MSEKGVCTSACVREWVDVSMHVEVFRIVYVSEWPKRLYEAKKECMHIRDSIVKNKDKDIYGEVHTMREETGGQTRQDTNRLEAAAFCALTR